MVLRFGEYAIRRNDAWVGGAIGRSSLRGKLICRLTPNSSRKNKACVMSSVLGVLKSLLAGVQFLGYGHC